MNVIPILCLTAEMDFQAGDYQKTEVFADYMSERLGTLIGAAVGGENWDGSSYGFSDTDTYSYEGDVSSEAGSFDFSDEIRSSFGGTEENTVDLSETTSSEEASDSSNGTESYRDSYLKELEGDSNVLFAVMYQGKLLSTNLEGLTAQKAEKGREKSGLQGSRHPASLQDRFLELNKSIQIFILFILLNSCIMNVKKNTFVF